jgi:hypothetical protein
MVQRPPSSSSGAAGVTPAGGGHAAERSCWPATGTVDRMVSPLRTAALAIAVAVAACSAPPLVPVPPVGVLTRVEVELGHDSTYAPAVTDPTRLAAIAAFVDGRRDSWRPDRELLRLGGTHARLWRDTVLVAVVSLQDGYLRRSQGEAPPLTQPISAEDAATFVRLLGAGRAELEVPAS